MAAGLPAGAPRHDLTTLPRALGWLALAVGVGVSSRRSWSTLRPLGFRRVDDAGPLRLRRPALAYTVASMAALLLRTIRQLAFVTGLHRRAAGLDLFDLRPAHAFTTLTARAGMGLALFLAFTWSFRR